MNSIIGKGSDPYSFNLGPRFARGLESAEDVALNLNPGTPTHLEIAFDNKAAPLDPKEVDTLRQYLMNAPRSELDQIFGTAMAADRKVDEAHNDVMQNTPGQLLGEGGMRLMLKGPLLAALFVPPQFSVPCAIAGALMSCLLAYGESTSESLPQGHSKVATFVLSVLDLSYLRRVLDATLGGGTKAKVDALEAARSGLRDELAQVQAKLADVARGAAGQG